MVRPGELRDRLRSQLLVADGAMGTLLQAHGTLQPYDHACLLAPDLVRDAHAAYARAGAGLVETCTFGANRVKLGAYALEREAPAINAAAAEAARRAVGSDVLVAGAMGPCGKSLAPVGVIDPQLAEVAFREQATALLDGGVDVILLETFNDLEELRIAYRVIRELADIAILAHKVFIEDGETLGAGLPGRVAAELADWEGVAAVGANCAIGPQRMVDVVRAMVAATEVPISAMPTPGLPQRIGSEVRYAVSPEYFGRLAVSLVEAGACIVGGCCGTTPEHIAAAASALRGMRPAERRSRAAAVIVDRPALSTAVPQQAQSAFRRKLGRQYVSAVEIDLPRGLDVRKVIDGAAALRDHGVDVIDISDGARARLRLNPLSVAHLIEREAGIEVMMHFACRDRNLLAVQADLLGAHVLGIRNILAVTGDPANIGDYPAATSVYDVDSVGLVRILRRFNEGIDLAGNSIGQTTAFTIAAAFDPLARNLDAERVRLRRKVEEGAHVIYTQPIFERSVLDVAVESVTPLGVPLLFGLLPLRSARHCEFMHNEVPGIRIPDAIRRRLSELEEEDARRYGVDVARSFLSDARHTTQGVYLMPPFGNHRVAAEVLGALR